MRSPGAARSGMRSPRRSRAIRRWAPSWSTFPLPPPRPASTPGRNRRSGRYGEARLAVAELASSLVSAGIGAAAFRQWTPGALSLGPAATQALAQQAAIAGFPLGATAGGLWYGLFPAKTSTAAIAGLTGALVVLPAMLSAFAGVATDPLQARFGLHDRRLARLLDALEDRLLGDAGPDFNPREPWVARILDLVDLLNLARRVLG